MTVITDARLYLTNLMTAKGVQVAKHHDGHYTDITLTRSGHEPVQYRLKYADIRKASEDLQSEFGASGGLTGIFASHGRSVTPGALKHAEHILTRESTVASQHLALA